MNSNFTYFNRKPAFHIHAIIWFVLITNFLHPVHGHTQEANQRVRFGLGLEIGNWSPSNLDNQVSLTPIKKIKNHPYIGFLLMKPWRYGLTLRTSVGYWKYNGIHNDVDEKKLEIVTLLIDLKYRLIQEVRLLPYVSYGIGWFLGSESVPEDALLEFDSKSEMGLGFNVGTGFDFNIYRELYLTMEFRYLYVKFNRMIAFTDIYSGPRISVGMSVLF